MRRKLGVVDCGGFIVRLLRLFRPRSGSRAAWGADGGDNNTELHIFEGVPADRTVEPPGNRAAHGS